MKIYYQIIENNNDIWTKANITHTHGGTLIDIYDENKKTIILYNPEILFWESNTFRITGFEYIKNDSNNDMIYKLTGIDCCFIKPRKKK